MKITIGVFAHVDAGKTTFCESLLYQTNRIKAPGRVDHGDSLMDHNELEIRRGITIFTDIASFSHNGQDYYLVDTPGHIDFSAEMERALMVLDAAVLLVSATDGVQSHTITVSRLLREHGIPVYIFINKTDQTSADAAACLADIQSKLHINCRMISGTDNFKNDDFIQWLCDNDDVLMRNYLENEVNNSLVLESVKLRIRTGDISLAVSGSALRQKGVLDMLDVIGTTITLPEADADLITNTKMTVPANPGIHSTDLPDFAARVFKVIYDAKGARVTFIKCIAGCLKVRDEVLYGGGFREKVNEIRDYQGKSYENVNIVRPGDIVGVVGLTQTVPGMGLGNLDDLPAPVLRPALKAAILLNGNPYDIVMDCLRKLETEDPLLGIIYEPSLKEISVQIMGKIQLEVLKDLILERFGLNIDFGVCNVVYRETVVAPVMGYGHFEPLRHYAEVHLRLEPNPNRGLEFESELHVDRLPMQFQNSIRHFALERDHKGILTGSSLTDVRFVLTNGAIHLEHTVGGDLREATYRAVRQGLEKAESVLLEPYYEFSINVDTAYAGRVLSDISRLHGTFEPPGTEGDRVRITGSGPVETFINYQAELLSFTKGTGAISYRLLGYLQCHDMQKVIERIGYQNERDTVNVSSSVFCYKGVGFEVKWNEVEKYMHL